MMYAKVVNTKASHLQSSVTKEADKKSFKVSIIMKFTTFYMFDFYHFWIL